MKTLLALCLAAASIALAHHSFAAEFDGNKPIKVTGTVTRVEWQNPHIWFYVDVKDEKGNIVTWGCEGANPGQLTRRGFKRGDVKIGDKLIVGAVDYWVTDTSGATVRRVMAVNHALLATTRTDRFRFQGT